MIFNLSVLQKAKFTEDEIDTFQKKYTGGISGGAGYDYQKYYAVHRLIMATNTFLDNKEDFGAKEQELCPVDDLVFIKEPSKYEFCQLKTNKNITWGYEGNKLEREFKQQKKLCEYCQLDYRLLLVIPLEKKLESLVGNIPPDLKVCTKVVFFPTMSKVSDFSDKNSPSYPALVNLSAFDQGSPDKCRNIAVAFFTAWNDRDRENNKFLFVSNILTSILAEDEMLPIRQHLELPAEWGNIQSLLGQIQGLEVFLIHGFCYYIYKKYEKGRIARQGTESFERFVKRVIKNQPKDFESFWELLP